MLKKFKELFPNREQMDDIYSSILYEKVELDYYTTHEGISISIAIPLDKFICWRALTNNYVATGIRLEKIKELHAFLHSPF